MNTKLKTSWNSTVYDFISPDVTFRHLRSIEAEPNAIEPIVHCFLYNGLFDGVPIDNPKINHEVLSLLEALERADRKIVLINAAQDDGEKHLAKIFPEKDWKFLRRMLADKEFSKRVSQRHDMPKAELLVSPHSERLHQEAHVTTVHPLRLMN